MGGEKILFLFDIDGTLTKSRQDITAKMKTFLNECRQRVSVGLVGGSDLEKIGDQMRDGLNVVNSFDYVFAENGLVAYKQGACIGKQSILEFMGEEKLQTFINYCLLYMSNIKLPVKRGNFVEFRSGLINICPVGRSCSQKERDDFGDYDKEHKIREAFVNDLRRKFPELGLTFSIGGQISFDCFPIGWDKTFCLRYIQNGYTKIHFFGDKTHEGGNDHEIFVHPDVVGHSVTSPDDTMEQVKTLLASMDR